MRKRTNRLDRVTEFIFISIIPFVLTVTLMLGGPENSIEKLIKTGYYISNPNEIADNYDMEIGIISGKQALSDGEISEYVSSSTIYSVPEDIDKLMKEAEEKYSDSVPAGNITEKDYSKQNATSEYDGVYVRNTTLSHDIDISEYLSRRVYADIDKSKPSVLIYHTHTSESYELLDRGFYSDDRASRNDNAAENMIRVGEAVCSVLEENGFKTIHDKTVYDETLSGAYDRARENISKILKENPSIQVVLDIHRDSIYLKDGTRIKTVSQINGEKVAQIMITTGCEDGNVTDFPNWEKNLTFALNLQQSLVREAPSLMRPLNLAGRKYNMDLMPCALHIEIGTDANTLTEAVNSATIFGEALSKLLKGYEI